MRRTWAVWAVLVVEACGGGAGADPADGAAGDSGSDAAVEVDTREDTASPADSAADSAAGPWAEAFAHVVPDDRLVDLRLDFAPGDWASLLSDWQLLRQKNEYPAAFTFDAESLARVAVRLKGLNSLRMPDEGPPPLTARYPLKIDFNALGGPRFHGVDELALNSAGNDPSRMRDWLTAHMYEAMGVDAARIGFAEVHIDGALVGPYVLAQVIDKRFLKERFGETDHADDGNLYKCVYNAFGACALEWLGPNKSDYARANLAPGDCEPGFDACGLVLQSNEDDPALNDYADLIHFLDVLHHTPDDAFPEAFAAVFDVDHFLRLAAVAYATSNFDSYFGKGHNYYLYRRSDGRFQMIPWDFDLAYEQPTCDADIADPTCGRADSHPLTRKILAVPAWRERYLAYLHEVATTWLTRERHAAWIGHAHALVADAVARDPNPPDVGFEATYATQTDPAGQGGGNLYAFVDARRAFILDRLAARSR